MPLPSRRGRRLTLAGIITSLALLLGSVGFVQFRAHQSWTTMQQKVGALHDEWRTRDHRREPLWGEATSTRAFTHYERAMAAVAPLERAHHQQLVSFFTRSDEQVAAAAGDLRSAWLPVIEHLRAGAHATDARPSQSPYGDPKAVVTELIPARWVAYCAVFEAKALRHAGRHVEAVQRALDAATLGADLLRDRVLIDQMIGTALVAIALDPFRDDALARLDRPAVDLLAQGLERLDRSLPEALDLSAEMLLCAWSLQQLPVDEYVGSLLSAWRYGFSSRWMIADALTCYADTAAEFASAGTLSWPQRKALMDLALEEHAASSNPISTILVPALSSAEAGVRLSLAQVRLLRMAVDLHRGRDLPPLRDPLGDGPLVVSHEANGVRLRSAGSTRQRPLERFVQH